GRIPEMYGYPCRNQHGGAGSKGNGGVDHGTHVNASRSLRGIARHGEFGADALVEDLQRDAREGLGVWHLSLLETVGPPVWVRRPINADCWLASQATAGRLGYCRATGHRLARVSQ